MGNVRELTSVTKQDNRRRITNWLPESEISWLEEIERRQSMVEVECRNGCEICSSTLEWEDGNPRYALFFKDGYFDFNHKTNDYKFLKITPPETVAATA
jgi:hypothetical protein